LLVLLVLSPLVWAVSRRWTDLQQSLSAVDWPTLGLSLLLLILLMPVMTLTPWFALQYLRAGLSLGQVFRLFFVSQVPKYLPGGVWAFPGRMVAYRSVGVSRAYSVISVVWETIALFAGAACVGLIGLSNEMRRATSVQPVIAIAALAVLAVLAIGQLPRIVRWLASFDFFKRSPLGALAGTSLDRLGVWWFPGAFGASLLFWLLLGFPFRLLLLAVSPSSASVTWIQAASIFSLAWCVGFIVVIAPAGLGVREGMLTLLLSRLMPTGAALGAALLARVWWMIAEGVWILAAGIWIARTATLPWELGAASEDEPVADEDRADGG
jgi:uncharacterized membrane protein YbhN (UPF0104 family)